MNKEIEIPFGAKDSELKGWEYTIPEDMEAEIKDGKIIVKQKESEDERIRKELWEYFHELQLSSDCDFSPSFTIDDILAYLEKQKEQKPESCDCSRDEESYTNGIHHVLMNPEAYGLIKLKPAEWSDSVAKEMFIKALERAVEQTKKGYELTDCDKHSWWEDFKAYSGIKPAEWSEEDESAFGDLIWCIEQARKSAKDENDMGNIWYAENWLKERLKSLRHSWKPSEEQMEALKDAFRKDGGNEYRKVINSLYCDLQKLL